MKYIEIFYYKTVYIVTKVVYTPCKDANDTHGSDQSKGMEMASKYRMSFALKTRGA